MGSSQSTKSASPPVEEIAARTNNVRSSIRTKQPMPDANELEKRFAKVLVSFIYLYKELLSASYKYCIIMFYTNKRSKV
jgi:hypothetical protein